MSKDEEALVVSIRSVRLQLHLAFLKQGPVVAVLEACLHEDAVLVRGEVLPTNNLANEEDLRLEVGTCPHLVIQLLQLVDLLLLQVLERLSFGVILHPALESVLRVSRLIFQAVPPVLVITVVVVAIVATIVVVPIVTSSTEADTGTTIATTVVVVTRGSRIPIVAVKVVVAVLHE